jgi:hypothetical protein
MSTITTARQRERLAAQPITPERGTPMETNANVIGANDSRTIVVMHDDGSMSTVKVQTDEYGMMNVLIDANPAIPHSVITVEAWPKLTDVT